MRVTRAAPHPALDGVIGAYADFEEATGSPRGTGEVPGRGIVVIVDLDQGWTVEGERFGSFAGGIYPRPVRVRHEGSSRGVQFDVEPPAFRALFGIPAGVLAERTVGLDAVMGADAARLAERLAQAPDPRTRFAVLDAVLSRALAQAGPPARPDVVRAWSLLRARGGRVRVDSLAAALGCSRRHLAKRFAEDVGASRPSCAPG